MDALLVYMHLFVVFTIPAFGMFETRGSRKYQLYALIWVSNSFGEFSQ